MPSLKTYDLFISHAWTYGDAYDKLVNLLSKAPYFMYRNYSIPRNDPVHTNGTDMQLQDAILRKIAPVNVVVIMAGVYATYSKWINKEIGIARYGYTYPKPILAVAPWGAERISQTVRKSADAIVGWNTQSIVAGIRRLAI